VDTFYLASKLRNAALIENNKKSLQIEYQPKFIQQITLLAKESDLNTKPVIHIYELCYKMLVNFEEEKYFEELIEALKIHSQLFTKTEIQNLYGYARNYCSVKMMSDNLKYQKKLFELYQTMIETNTLLVNGQLHQWIYNNIVILSTRLQKLEFAEKFIVENKKWLAKEHQQNAFTYVTALLHFARKDYDKTLKALHNIEFSDPLYKVHSKSLLMKTYYELEELIPLASHNEAFSRFLKNNKQLSKQHITLYQNLIKYVKKMVRVKMSSKIPVQKLKKQVNEIKQFADFEWLNEKLEELIESNK